MREPLSNDGCDVSLELIGHIIEVYVDDIVVKSNKTGDLVPDLTEVFAKLQQHGVKLNAEK
jgi:hypothetical protein